MYVQQGARLVDSRLLLSCLHTCLHAYIYLASFPGPTQLSIASVLQLMESWAGPGNKASLYLRQFGERLCFRREITHLDNVVLGNKFFLPLLSSPHHNKIFLHYLNVIYLECLGTQRTRIIAT